MCTQEELISYVTTMTYKAVIDSEQKYRYTLTREWDTALPKITYIMLNPSIADQLKGDPTMNRCLNFAVDNGYGSIELVILFAYRSTNPAALRKVVDPIGNYKHRDQDFYHC